MRLRGRPGRKHSALAPPCYQESGIVKDLGSEGSDLEIEDPIK